MLGCVSRVLAGAAVARSCQVAARRGVAVSRLHTHEMEIGDGRCGTQKIFDRYRKYLLTVAIIQYRVQLCLIFSTVDCTVLSW